MNTILQVAYIAHDFCAQPLDKLFAPVQAQQLSFAPWVETFPYRPLVSFKLCYTDRYLCLEYRVLEDFIKAAAYEHNQAVWEDSCVEMFISFDQLQTYYNIEFNPLGNGLVGYGSADKKNRKRLTADLVDRIQVYTSIQRVQRNKQWITRLLIPIDLFQVGEQALTSLQDRTAHANFYKCGDQLPKPHFLSWMDIKNPTPNFHLPQFFGQIKFV